MNDNDQQPPTLETYRALLNQSLNKTPKKEEVKPLDLFGFIEGFLKEYETKLNDKTAKPVTKTTLRVYRQSLRVLREFKEKNYRNRDFSFAQIDYYFYTQFQQYLVKQNFATNTIGKHIRTLKTFFLEARERGLMPNFSTKKFKAASESSDAIYLNEREINTLFELDLNMNPRLEKIRDLFLVGCWAGLRFSDCAGSPVYPDKERKHGRGVYRNGNPKNSSTSIMKITGHRTARAAPRIFVYEVHQSDTPRKCQQSTGTMETKHPFKDRTVPYCQCACLK